MMTTDDFWCDGGDFPLPTIKKRQYARCPICGRRVLLKETIDFNKSTNYAIPPHKIRKTKRKKKRRI